MSGSRSPRPGRRASLRRLLLLAFVMTGLLGMHGVQAATSPADRPALPMAPAHLPRLSSADQPGLSTGRPAGHTADQPAGHSAGRAPGPGHDGHSHPGGPMCLALLSLALLLLLAARRVLRTAGSAATAGTPARAVPRRCRGRPPPSVFTLSVLRL